MAVAKTKLRARWKALKKLPNSGKTFQHRGYRLEALLHDLLSLEAGEANVSPSFRRKGEQIDGFFDLFGRSFLYEAKWLAAPPPASEIYSFRSKVEGKLTGTVGLFISIAGFPRDIAEVLSHGKHINVLLFDGSDVRYALRDKYSFTQVLSIKLRRAAQYGDVYYNFKRHLDEAKV